MLILKILNIFLLLVLSSTVFSKISLIDQQVDFLIKQKNFYELTQDANLAHLKDFKKCLIDKDEVLIKKAFVDSETLEEIEINCSIVISKIFNRRIKSKLSRLRLVMSLMKQEKIAKNNFLTYPMHTRYKININIKHPDKSSLVSLAFELMQPNPLSDPEISKALLLFDQQTNNFCEEYKKDELLSLISTYTFVLKENQIAAAANNFCDKDFFQQIKKNSNSRIRTFYRSLEQKYNLWLETQRIEMRNIYKKEYYELLNFSPYFLLLTSLHPTNNELLATIETIYKNAYQIKNQTITYIIDNEINRKIKHFKQARLNSSEKESLQDDLMIF